MRRPGDSRRQRARRWFWRLALMGGTALGGCFSPSTPPCAFTCISAGHLCPDDYSCGADGLCHRDGAQDVCGLTAPYGAGGMAGAASGMAGAAGGTAGGAGGAGAVTGRGGAGGAGGA